MKHFVEWNCTSSINWSLKVLVLSYINLVLYSSLSTFFGKQLFRSFIRQSAGYLHITEECDKPDFQVFAVLVIWHLFVSEYETDCFA